MTTPGVIALTEDVPTAGAIVWWRLSGTVLIDELEDAWDDHGLDVKELPQPPIGIAALRRAVLEQQQQRRLVRKLADGSGYALVIEKADGRDLDYDVHARFTLNPIGVLECEGNAPEKLKEQVRVSYAVHQAELSPTDVGTFLVKQVESHDGVRLRDTGGIYFVPSTALDAWRKVTQALKVASGHLLFEVPALRSEDAVEAVLDAIAQEAAQEADTIAREMAEQDLGERALDNRAERAKAMRAKVQRYEQLLGRELDTLTERLQDLGAQLTVAALKAAKAKEAAE